MKKAYFYIDDVIWLFRDLTRKRPESAFDNEFLALLKEGHDKYGMKVQLNVFYRTDFFYGEDEFTLSEMTDAYKEEFTAASDWLKFGFHSKQEFPDYPYINADYDEVKTNLERTKKEVARFACEKSFAYAVVPHWLPISKDGVKALKDGGIKLLGCSYGERTPYNGDPFSLPYGHAHRLMHNRKPETMLFTRKTPDKAIENSLSGYNHLSEDEANAMWFTFDTKQDAETGMHFKRLTNSPCINLNDEETIIKKLTENFKKDAEYIAYGTHEQYFYSDYFNYQPDYPKKLLTAAKLCYENGYEYFFAEELVK